MRCGRQRWLAGDRIVDASDNHGEIRKIVEGLFEDANTHLELQFLRAEAGSSYRRNVGVRRVQSPVVFFRE